MRRSDPDILDEVKLPPTIHARGRRSYRLMRSLLNTSSGLFFDPIKLTTEGWRVHESYLEYSSDGEDEGAGEPCMST